MKSLIKKFVSGIRTDAKGTIVKAVLYSLRIVGDALADGFYFIFIIPLLILPPRTLARIKHKLSPTVRLDYARDIIKIQADSLLDLFRARACEKEPETVTWIENYIKAGEVFFDVGANIGAYSLIATAYHKGNIIVHAFEPSFSSYHQLCRNIIENGFQKSITPHMVGLTEDIGMITFHYQSLDAGSADHWLGTDVPNGFPFQFIYNQQLFGFSVDYLIEYFGLPVPNHIKLDVDGTEVDVLHGAEKTLQLVNLKSILVEVRSADGMSDEVSKILASNGFYLVSKTDRGDGITWNCIYVR